MSLFNFPAHTMEEVRVLYKSGIPKDKLILNILYDRAFWKQRNIPYHKADEYTHVAENFVEIALQGYK